MRRLPASRPLLVAVSISLSLLCASCGKKGPPLYPVRGEVFFDGKPAAGAIVVLHPAGDDAVDAPRPSGQVKEDGSFELDTFPHGKGAPAGDYKVAIVWYDPKGEVNPQTGEAPSLLPARYASPATSGLGAHVDAGPTQLKPYQLSR